MSPSPSMLLGQLLQRKQLFQPKRQSPRLFASLWLELTKRQPVEQWDNDQRDAVAAQLKPIAELYQRITKALMRFMKNFVD